MLAHISEEKHGKPVFSVFRVTRQVVSIMPTKTEFKEKLDAVWEEVMIKK